MKPKAHRPDLILIFVTLILTGFGLIMIFSSSSVNATLMQNNPYFYVQRQSVWAIASLVVMFIMMWVPNSWLRWIAPAGYLVSLGALLLVPVIGTTINGSKRWLDFGFTTLMPSEMVKPFLVMALALLLEKLGAKIKSLKYLFLALLPLIPIAGLVISQPDLGTTLVIVGCYGVMLLVGGIRLIYAVFAVGGVAGAVALVINFTEYMKNRIDVWLNPWSDPQGDGWQIIQSLYAIGSGGLLGLGLGHSRQKYGYLPEPMTDFIFSITAEELGFVGAIAVILLFVVFLWRGYRIALTAPDIFTSLVAVGITTMIVLQAFVNIAVVTSTIPATGIPLPFISSGGTSLMLTVFSTGVLLNISRYTKAN